MRDETLPPTPGQTVGPFFHFGLEYPRSHELVSPDAPGAVTVRGTVVDGAGQPVPDAFLELWQPGPDGTADRGGGHIARAGAFTGFGRAVTDAHGQYGFTTLLPGPMSAGTAPFIAVTLFARGLLDRLFTRMYVPSDAVDADPFLQSLEPHRRASLIAQPTADGDLRFDIALQGEHETVFLDFAYGGSGDGAHG